MLEPRQADVPLMFLLLVVLPVVVYILLGRWSDSSKRKESLELVFGEESAESYIAETMSSTSVIPPAPLSNASIRVCSRCSAPATTRCSRCKSVRYCSGKCQIMHWRQGHKEECRPAEDFPEQEQTQCNVKYQEMNQYASATDTGTMIGAQMSKPERKMSEKRVSRKSSTEGSSRKNSSNSKEAYMRNKLRGNGSVDSEDDFSKMHCTNGSSVSGVYGGWEKAQHLNVGVKSQNKESSVLKQNDFAETTYGIGSTGSKNVNSESVKCHSTKVRKTHLFDDSGSVKAVGLKKSSKMSRLNPSQTYMNSCKKVQGLFPYEEFTKFFSHDVFDLTPRGLLNCGNSCYANAVLQCLTCTKPLVAYLLNGTHSRACCPKNWCLMCELEQHVMSLREVGGPLSPSRILTYIRNLNSQIGDGSQEDAHEFLRLLVASMQSICLEEAGGESQVHPNLQETTFIMQTFGGRLRSMVRCLRCHHESERYENIMDLSLEIYGWVESLEDALTQFTTPEDLDGENMYRCGRCASYVRARKQLSIDEAPNILTIVLKRFQEGNYGKINKCITFPEMLDMNPFMTGTNDEPPLYTLYGVVVHVDTLNASFSGHYVSYVKDLHGNWFRIDDLVVQRVPTSQVMSDGAYILFYMRSSPRPPRADMRKPSRPRTRNRSDTGQTVNRYSQSMETSEPTSSDWSLFTSSDDASFTSESTRDSFSSTVDYSDTCNIDPFPSQRTISCRMFSGSNPVTRYVSEEEMGFVQIGGIPEQDFISDSGYQNFVNYESYDDDFRRTFGNCHI